MYFQLFMVVYTLAAVHKNSQQDKGKFVAAKWTQAILLGLLVYVGLGEIGDGIRFIFNSDEYLNHISATQLEVSRASLVFFKILGTLGWGYMMYIVFKMIRRDDTYRKRFIMLIYFLAIATVPSFYVGWVGADATAMGTKWSIMGIGLVIMALIASIPVLVYSLGFMKRYYGANPTAQLIEDSEILDASIANSEGDQTEQV